MTDRLLCDYCFWIYSAIVVVSFYGFSLFLWWWHKIGKASEIYIYFTILLVSEGIYNFFNALARYLRFNDDDLSDYMALMDHPVWQLRGVLHLIILSLIIGRMSIRAYRTMKMAKRFKLEDNNVSNSNR